MSKHSGINATRDVLKDQLALAAEAIISLRWDLTIRYQLWRWGSPYACWGTRDDVIRSATFTSGRPWWWMRLMGWSVRQKESA